MKPTLEPEVITLTDSEYKSKIAHVLNWYSQEKTKSDAKQYLIAYVKKNLPDYLDRINSITDSSVISTYGWLARLITRGNEISKENVEKLHSYLTNLPERKQVDEKIEIKKVDIQLVTNNKINEMLGELEGKIDDFILTKAEFKLINHLKLNDFPKKSVDLIIENIGKKIKDIEFCQADEEYQEAYSNFSKIELRHFLNFLNQIKTDAEKYADYKRANRKPRAKKQLTPIKQIEKLKYKKEDLELNLKSILPTEIIGAGLLLVYNTKYKLLSSYVSTSSRGLSIKGTTIQNFEPELSVQKRVKKLSILPAFVASTKGQNKRLLAQINTKESPAKGRVNEDCILLKVEK